MRRLHARAESAGAGERPFYLVWALASLTYVLGDGVLTLALLEANLGLVEANGLVRYALETFGSTGIFGVKAGVMVLCLSLSVSLGDAESDRLVFYGPPILLTVAGLVASLYNVTLVV